MLDAPRSTSSKLSVYFFPLCCLRGAASLNSLSRRFSFSRSFAERCPYEPPAGRWKCPPPEPPPPPCQFFCATSPLYLFPWDFPCRCGPFHGALTSDFPPSRRTFIEYARSLSSKLYMADPPARAFPPQREVSPLRLWCMMSTFAPVLKVQVTACGPSRRTSLLRLVGGLCRFPLRTAPVYSLKLAGGSPFPQIQGLLCTFPGCFYNHSPPLDVAPPCRSAPPEVSPSTPPMINKV